MTRLLLASLLVLAACGQTEVLPVIPPDLTAPEPGWQGPPPTTQGTLLAAALAERNGRLRANEKLGAIEEIVGE